jgi:protein-tyrosine phosphatase
VLELADHRRRGVPTLVHCQAGQSRSPTVIALYWMARDGLAWEEAYQRIRRTRPQAQPHPLLTDAETRAAVVGEVRALLAGDGGVLAAARADAAALRAAHRDRGPEPDRRTFDWNLIETGLGCGVPPQDPDDLGRAGFTALLQLEPAARRAAWGVEAEAIGLPDLTPVDPPRLAAAVARLHAWRAAGRTVLVACGDGKSRSALVIALYHVATRGWDLAGALWYLRHRRRGAWPRPQLLEGRTPAQLVEACRAAFPPSG